MIPLKSWIEKLILRCAKKDEVNKFIKEQQVEKKVNIVNSDVATNSVPTPNTTGVLGSVDFKDARDALIAALEAYRTPTEGKGIRLRINDNYLGFRVSDEGIPTSYVNHPNPVGPANQIATMKYVADWGNAITHYLDTIHELLDQTRADIQTIRESVALLDFLRHIDDVPTEGSNNLVRSGGIYSFVISRLGTGLNNLRAELLDTIRNNSSGLIDSYSGGGWINGPANYLKFKFGDEVWLLQWFVRSGSGGGYWPAGSYSRTPLGIVSPSWPGGGHYAVDHVDNLSFDNTSYSFEKYEGGGSATICALGRTN